MDAAGSPSAVLWRNLAHSSPRVSPTRRRPCRQKIGHPTQGFISVNDAADKSPGGPVSWQQSGTKVPEGYLIAGRTSFAPGLSADSTRRILYVPQETDVPSCLQMFWRHSAELDLTQVGSQEGKTAS